MNRQEFAIWQNNSTYVLLHFRFFFSKIQGFLHKCICCRSLFYGGFWAMATSVWDPLSSSRVFTRVLLLFWGWNAQFAPKYVDLWNKNPTCSWLCIIILPLGFWKITGGSAWFSSWHVDRFLYFHDVTQGMFIWDVSLKYIQKCLYFSYNAS